MRGSVAGRWAVSVLAAALLGGCGTEPAVRAIEPDPTAPATATGTAVPAADTETFCASYVEQFRAMQELDPEDAPARVRSIQGWLDGVTATGLPADVPAAARAGFEILDRLVGDLDPETATLESLTQEPAPAQERRLDAFGEWLEASCPELQEALDEEVERAFEEREQAERPGNGG